MRKIPIEYENPLDSLYITIAELICPFLYSLDFSPNGITTLSLIFGLLAVYCLEKESFIGFVLSYLLSYFFDCVDGHYARKFDMVTSFGDKYDHIKDVIIVALIIYVAIRKNNCTRNEYILLFSILIIFGILMLTHLGCQEMIYNKDSVLSFSTMFCGKEGIATRIKSTRYFGCFTFVVVFLSVIVYLKNKKKCKL